jgi:hypothetical protein
MTIEQAILDVVHNLPPDKQKEILDYASELRKGISQRRSRKSGRGLLADLPLRLTEEEIDEARKEMWKNFPREDI